VVVTLIYQKKRLAIKKKRMNEPIKNPSGEGSGGGGEADNGRSSPRPHNSGGTIL